MVTQIEKQPISSGLVVLSITTSVINSSPATVKVTLVAREELLPTSTDYITAQNMLPEIVSRAGLEEDVEFTTITEESHTTASNGNHIYKMQLDAANS